MEDKIFKYGKDIVWSLPVIFEYEHVWGAIVKTLREFCIEAPRVNGFGCPRMNWYGGRFPHVIDEIGPTALYKRFEYCKEIGITPSFTFTKSKITKDDLKDRYANYLVDIALEFDAHFIVYSDILKDYIKEKNPNAYMVASIIKSIEKFQGPNAKNWSVENETNYYNKLLKEYDMVVVRPEYSESVLIKNPSLIDDISRIEVLINQTCVRNCPKAMEHYHFIEDQNYNKSFECMYSKLKESNSIYDICVSHDKETVEKLVEYGVKHLKVQGRGNNNTALGMSLMLFTRIFEITGNKILILEELMRDVASKEYVYFTKFISNKL